MKQTRDLKFWIIIIILFIIVTLIAMQSHGYAEESYPSTYNLTIHYWYKKKGGKSAAPTYQNTAAMGEKIKIDSPPIAGWYPNIDAVITENPKKDIIVNIIYKKILYTLTIRYQYSDGSGKVVKSFKKKIQAGKKYSIKSPEINGYKPDKKRISGRMPKWGSGGKVTKTVYYKEVAKSVQEILPLNYIRNIVFYPSGGWIMYLPE